MPYRENTESRQLDPALVSKGHRYSVQNHIHNPFDIA
jgi:hypothetical protein